MQITLDSEILHTGHIKRKKISRYKHELSISEMIYSLCYRIKLARCYTCVNLHYICIYLVCVVQSLKNICLYDIYKNNISCLNNSDYYRKRRKFFSDLAMIYRHGQSIPRVKVSHSFLIQFWHNIFVFPPNSVQYTREEVETWGKIYCKLRELHKKLVFNYFNYFLDPSANFRKTFFFLLLQQSQIIF